MVSPTGVTLTTGKTLPPPQTPFVDPKTGTLSNDGYQYFMALLNTLASAIPTASLALGLIAQGSGQSTALQLTSPLSVITSVVAGNGVLLSAYNPGQSQTVFNQSGSPINIFPPPGFAIDALAVNVPYSLTSGKMQIFNFESATQILSTQLQIP